MQQIEIMPHLTGCKGWNTEPLRDIPTKVRNLNLHVRIQQTNPDQGTFYKITDLLSKVIMKVKKKLRKYSR